MPLDETSLDEQLEVTRNSRLRLPEDHHELTDRQFSLDEQGKQPQARASRPPPSSAAKDLIERQDHRASSNSEET